LDSDVISKYLGTNDEGLESEFLIHTDNAVYLTYEGYIIHDPDAGENVAFSVQIPDAGVVHINKGVKVAFYSAEVEEDVVAPTAKKKAVEDDVTPKAGKKKPVEDDDAVDHSSVDPKFVKYLEGIDEDELRACAVELALVKPVKANKMDEEALVTLISENAEMADFKATLKEVRKAAKDDSTNWDK
jgi:hypothetical protein